MSLVTAVALGCVLLVAVASGVIGSFGVRFARSTSDFLAASRTVSTTTSAGAISAEYLSAAAFLGVAGLVLKDGPDALWYPVAFAAGYLMLMIFVVGPLRRSGAYTLPDFVELRLRSKTAQRLCSFVVMNIGWLLFTPQLQGAGLAVATLAPGVPAWTGSVLTGVLVVAVVLFGGMRSITFVQAFQYWVKLTALAVPLLVLASVAGLGTLSYDRPAPPRFTADTRLAVHSDVRLQVVEPVRPVVHGVVDGRPVDGTMTWLPGEHTVAEGSTLWFPAGRAVPVPVGSPAHDDAWLVPGTESGGVRLLALYSVLVAGLFGAMGLPNIIMRLYASADVRSARRAGVVVLALLGGLFLLPTLLGVLARAYVPQLLVNGDGDAAVLVLPTAVLGAGPLGAAVTGLVAAGAWAAFLATSSGLAVSIASVLAANPTLLRRKGWGDFRLATVIAGLAPVALALGLPRLDFVVGVSAALAVAASTFCPLLLLGIWWRGLTLPGAVAGLITGALVADLSLLCSALVTDPSAQTMLERPALFTVPLAFAVFILVSKLTAGQVPPDVARTMSRMHLPERLTLHRPDPRTEPGPPDQRS